MCGVLCGKCNYHEFFKNSPKSSLKFEHSLAPEDDHHRRSTRASVLCSSHLRSTTSIICGKINLCEVGNFHTFSPYNSTIFLTSLSARISQSSRRKVVWMFSKTTTFFYTLDWRISRLANVVDCRLICINRFFVCLSTKRNNKMRSRKSLISENWTRWIESV